MPSEYNFTRKKIYVLNAQLMVVKIPYKINGNGKDLASEYNYSRHATSKIGID